MTGNLKTSTEKRQLILENLIYTVLWLVIFSGPVIGYKFQQNGTVVWNEVFRTWKMALPFLILFLLNNFVLSSWLLIRKRYIWYLIASLLSIYIVLKIAEPFPGFHKGLQIKPRIADSIGERSDSDTFFPDEFFIRPGGNPLYGNLPKYKPGGEFIRLSPLANGILIAILLFGFNIAIKLLFLSIRNSHEMETLQRHNLQTELENLKHQINPHFFMNTLNNIHALIDINTEKAKETVIELSKMMRYVLYESGQPLVLLEKEISFLNNYIALMQLRYTDKVRIHFDLPDKIPSLSISPLLLIPFVENAFKHGVSYQKESLIEIRLTVSFNTISFFVTNDIQSENNPKPGIGLENTIRRLDLLYGNQYALQINQKDARFRVSLNIPAYDTMFSH